MQQTDMPAGFSEERFSRKTSLDCSPNPVQNPRMNRLPWTPEIELTDEKVRAVLQGQFAALAPTRVERLDAGWDNVVYRVNGKWLFRFPHRAAAEPFLLREMKSLPWLSSFLMSTGNPRTPDIIQVPKPDFIGTPTDQYPWHFYGYAPVHGLEACDCRLSEDERAALAAPLAYFLKRLHGTEPWEQLRSSLPFDPVGRLDFPKRVPMTMERLAELQRSGVALDYPTLEALLRHALDTPRLGPSSVVHGDLHFRHLVLNEGRRLAGVIDWGDIHLNDPAVDLSIVWSFFPPHAREVFWKHYGPVTDDQKTQSRAFAVFENTALLVYARAERRETVEREARIALDWVLKDA